MHPPGLTDLQVNGYAGVDFTDPATTPEQLHAACARLEADGVAGILATVITERVERMAAALVLHMADLSSVAVRGLARDRPDYFPSEPMVIPSWLENAA